MFHQPNLDQSEKGQKVELFFACRNLVNLDGIAGKSDPLIKVYLDETEIGQTEHIRNNLNPSFQKPVDLLYTFEKRQYITVKLIDIDGEEATGNHQQIGEAKFELAQVVSNGKLGYEISLTKNGGGQSTGQLIVKAEPSAVDREDYHIDLKANNVKNVEWFSKSDPFIRFFRPNDAYLTSPTPTTIPDNQWTFVHETEFVKDSLTPDFVPFSISSSKFCKNNKNTFVKMELWDNSKEGNHTYLGKGFFTVNQLQTQSISFIDTTDNNGKMSGRVNIESFKAMKRYSFMDFLRGGLQISLYLGIDFTASNGDPRMPQSLHYMDPSGQLNCYEKGCQAAISILGNYDNDKKVPVFGFGGCFPAVGITQVSHCFPLSGNPVNTDVRSTDELFQLYRQVLPSLQFSGPTYFAPIIIECCKTVEAARSQGYFGYTVLTILTDGVINDMAQAISAMITASTFPISIVVVGIGNEDFSAMDVLDSDKGFLRQGDKVAKRDMVQFVKFNDHGMSLESLGIAMLREIPEQISAYFNIMGIVPPM